MTKKQLKSRIDRIVGSYKEVTEFFDSLELLGLSWRDGKAFDLIWKMFDTLLDEIPDSDDIAWYIFDNNCGEAEKKYPSYKNSP